MKFLVLLVFGLCLSGCASECDKLRQKIIEARTTIAEIPPEMDDVKDDFTRTIDGVEKQYRNNCQ